MGEPYANSAPSLKRVPPLDYAPDLMSSTRASQAARTAFAFVVTMGIVNLLADTTYEGGAGLNGPFLALLGAGGAAVSIVAGFGEFLGYALRSVSGWVADRTGRYWPITFVGYVINLLAVPAMALAGSWRTAAALLVLERVGRAIRKPSVEAMLSYSATTLGRGWVYGLNTALDETGATLGPLLVALLLARGRPHRFAYAVLLVPAVLTLIALLRARMVFPVPSRLERGRAPGTGAKGFTRRYWLTMIAAACFGAGLMSFEFISFHLSSAGRIEGAWIPVVLAMATVAGIIASLALGRLYDRQGAVVVGAAMAAAALFSPMVFLGGPSLAIAGLLLWGVGYAVQDTLLKAVVAGMLPEGRRGLAFGLFYAGYGGGWLVGSVATGLLYRQSVPAVVAFSVAAQAIAVPLFLLAQRGKVTASAASR
jgi:MFS family permease